MSTLTQIIKRNTDFNIVSSPKQMPRYVVQSNQLWAKLNNNLRDPSNPSWDILWQTSTVQFQDKYLVQATSNNTWYDIANITNANGGYLRQILLPASTNTLNNLIECRITVDGEVYNYTYTNTYSADHWTPFIGTLNSAKQYEAADVFETFRPNNLANWYNTFTTWKRSNADGQWITHRYDATLPNPSEWQLVTSLKYNNSIRVEIKMSLLNSTPELNFGYASISQNT